MKRREFLKYAALAAATPLVAQRAAKRPNVLFVMVDEWRAQATGYSGDRNVRTPHLDKFAGESVHFKNAVSGLPVCCPARASLMTGQYPLRHGVFVNDVELKPNAPALGEVFAKAGYRTGYIGKWHLYGSPDGHYGRRLLPVPPDKRLGFDYWKACECSHDYNHSLYYEGNDPTQRYWQGYDAIAQTEDARQFLRGHAKKAEPFFLFLSLGPPHFPLETAPEKYRALYAQREIELRPNVPPAIREEATRMLRGYYAHIAALDDCLESLLATLQQQGIAEDTIVLFTADHGDMMLSQNLTTKSYPWDESACIPFLLRYPRALQPRVILQPLDMPNIMPTLLSLAGLKVPAAVQGRDLSPIARGLEKDDEEAAALLNLPVPFGEARRHGFAEYRGLRTARYTYVRSIHGPWLLYDRLHDPYQMHNLCADSGQADLRARLDLMLDQRLHAVNDEFLPAGHYIEQAGVGHYAEVTQPIGQCKSPWGDWASTVS